MNALERRSLWPLEAGFWPLDALFYALTPNHTSMFFFKTERVDFASGTGERRLGPRPSHTVAVS